MELLAQIFAKPSCRNTRISLTGLNVASRTARYGETLSQNRHGYEVQGDSRLKIGAVIYEL